MMRTNVRGIHTMNERYQTDRQSPHQSASGRQTDRNSKQWRHCRQDNRKRQQNYSNFIHTIKKVSQIAIQLRSSGWVAENVLAWLKWSDIYLPLTELKTKEFHFADLGYIMEKKKESEPYKQKKKKQIEVIFIKIFFATL